jgi:hypothetical protein
MRDNYEYIHKGTELALSGTFIVIFISLHSYDGVSGKTSSYKVNLKPTDTFNSIGTMCQNLGSVVSLTKVV